MVWNPTEFLSASSEVYAVHKGIWNDDTYIVIHSIKYLFNSAAVAQLPQFIC